MLVPERKNFHVLLLKNTKPWVTYNQAANNKLHAAQTFLKNRELFS
jgi:hypothetical protein